MLRGTEEQVNERDRHETIIATSYEIWPDYHEHLEVLRANQYTERWRAEESRDQPDYRKPRGIEEDSEKVINLVYPGRRHETGDKTKWMFSCDSSFVHLSHMVTDAPLTCQMSHIGHRYAIASIRATSSGGVKQ